MVLAWVDGYGSHSAGAFGGSMTGEDDVYVEEFCSFTVREHACFTSV